MSKGSKVWCVSRPINGITLNGDGEMLLDENDEVKYFASQEAAKQYLRENGVGDDEMEFLNFHQSIGVCKRCGSPLFKSFIDEYTSQCFGCDEDFYSIEQETLA